MLDKIRLRNFKAFADQEVPFSRLTLLTGLNSSGKSSVLQSLAVLRQSFEASMVDNGRGLNLLLNGGLVELGTGRDVRHEAWVETQRAGGAIEFELTAGEATDLWSAEYGADDDLLRLSGDMWDPGGKPAALMVWLAGNSFQYLRADRINPAVSYPRTAAVRDGFLGAKGEHTVNFLRQHQDDDVPVGLRHPEAVSNQLLRQVEAWLGHLCPGVNLYATGIDGTDTVRLAFSFGAGGLSSSNKYRPTNVGFGLTYVLPIVVACLTAQPGGLILLENPEAHLHPRGQSAMAELIARAAAVGAQVIVESHSDHVLNGMRIAVKRGVLPHTDLRLLYFRTAADGSKQIDSPAVGPDGTLSQWPEGFFDEWDRALDELID